jgi:tetratricopeptide (TPR) repeat protein
VFGEGHIDEAETLQREALASEIRQQGPDHPNSLEMQTYLAATLNAEGRYAEAEKLARQTCEAELRIHGPQHTHTVNALQQLGIAMAHTQRYAEASALFRDAIKKRDNSTKPGDAFDGTPDMVVDGLSTIFLCAAQFDCVSPRVYDFGGNAIASIGHGRRIGYHGRYGHIPGRIQPKRGAYLR